MAPARRQSPPDARSPLGVGDIMAETLVIYFERFWLMLGLALVPSVIGLAAMWAATGASRGGPGVTTGWTVAVAGFAELIAWTLSNAVIVLAAFDAKLNRPPRIGEYVRRALVNLVTIIVLSVAVAIGIAIVAAVIGFAVSAVATLLLGSVAAGIVAIIVLLPICLYLWAALSPFVPVIVIENRGFRSLGKAWQLTAGYRWPVVGAMVLLVLIAGLAGVVGAVLRYLLASLDPVWLPLLSSLAVAAIQSGILAVGMALIYARLRTLKEGLGMEALADVFS
jgi:hypothetical protein